MRKIKTLFVLLTLLITINPSFCAFEQPEFVQKYKAWNFIRKHNSALKKHDVKKVKTFYSKDYKSADGFTTSDLEEMLKKTYSAYDNLKYKTKINNITLYDNAALVQLSDVTTAKIYPNNKKTKQRDKVGKLKGKSSYVIYLKKDEDNSYKIISDNILMEETSLKYGIANKIKMNLETPVFVKNGETYDLKLNMEKPEDILALASISREEIVYPPLDYAEKFRKIPSDGGLERIVKANNKNKDEYAIASVGFTKISVNKEITKAKIEILGMAYIMKRINLEKNFLESKKL